MRKLHNMKLLHLDIETAPATCYTWSLFPKYLGLDMMVKPGYMLSWSAKWEGDRGTEFRKHTDPDFLAKMWDLLDEADAVVHYNGTAFDMKHIHKEFILAGYSPPAHYHQIDLLKTVRKQFKFQSNKLDHVAQELGLGKKTKHKGMQLWVDCMNGCSKAWKVMEKYNRQDVVLTQKLYKRLLPWIHNHPNVGMYVDDPASPVCTNCGSRSVVKRGRQYNTSTASYDRFSCNNCGTPLRGRFRTQQTSPNVLRRTN